MTRPLSSLLLITSVLIASVLFLPSPALAQRPADDQDPNFLTGRSISWQVKPQAEWEKIIKQCDNPTNPQLNSECFSGPFSLGSTLSTLLATVQGSTDGSSPGMTAILTSLYATTLFSQPSSLDYLAYVGQNFDLNLVRPAYAQGLGFTNFQPLVTIWSIFRNLAYLVFVVVLIVVGFMVMFRRKLDPQTVIGIQQAIPGIIIALLLITFSYAIVGFMIDLMILLVSTIAIYLSNNFSLLDNPTKIIAVANLSIFELINPLRQVVLPIRDSVSAVVGELINVDLSWPFDALVEKGVQLIFSVSIVIAMFKIFFMLLENYIHIILSLIFGPLQLSLAAIPGNKSLRSWLMGLLSHILVFPVTFTLIFIASLFATQETNSVSTPLEVLYSKAWPSGEPTWAPPLLGGALQQQADINAPPKNLAGPLITFGILLTIPQIAAVIKSQLEVKELPAGETISQQLGRGAGWIPGFGGLAQRALSS